MFIDNADLSQKQQINNQSNDNQQSLKNLNEQVAEHYKNLILARANAQTLIVIGSDNKTKEVPVRMPNQGEYCIVDYVSFVCHLDDLYKWATYSDNDSDNPFYGNSWIGAALDTQLEDKQTAINHIADKIGETLAGIFGEDVDDVFSNVSYTGSGMFGYKFSCNIGSRENLLGKVCFGRNNNTCLVSITGLGCSVAVSGWEKRLYEFLCQCQNAKITRIDLAHDDFNGDYSCVESSDMYETDGLFYTKGTRPKVQQLGDWKYNLGDGRTLQIGNRANGKVERIYEKGKQLGDKGSKWLRTELEISNANRVIPFDILINPTAYFCGAYPYNSLLIDNCRAFNVFVKKNRQLNQNASQNNTSEPTSEIIAQRIPILVKGGEISLKKSLSIWQKQCGKYIAAFRQIFQDDSFILDLLQAKKVVEYPKRLASFINDDVIKYVPKMVKTKVELFKQAKQSAIENGIDFTTFLKSDSFYASLVGNYPKYA